MNTKEFSSKQESTVADFLGWSVVSGSGARPCVPGDIQSDEWLGECKTHSEKGQKIFFDYSVWDKIQHEADVKHRKPVLIVDDGSQNVDSTWVLCREVSIDLSTIGVADLDCKIRKNVTFDGSSQLDKMKSLFTKKNGCGILFDHCLYTLNWNGCKVVIMPLATFKEVMNL